MFKDALFKKIEQKTNVDKDTIMNLANNLQNSNMKDKNVLYNLVDTISNITGKNISQEKKDKIVNTILNDNIPNTRSPNSITYGITNTDDSIVDDLSNICKIDRV